MALRLHQNEKHDGTYTVPGSAGHASLEPSKADESPSTYKRKRDAGSDDEDFSSHVEVSTAMPAYKEITVEIDDGNLDVRLECLHITRTDSFAGRSRRSDSSEIRSYWRWLQVL